MRSRRWSIRAACSTPAVWAFRSGPQENERVTPQTYRAIRLERIAPSFREGAEIVTLPLAEPQRGEIRVRNLHCGVNAIFDTQIARDAVDYVKIALPTFTGVEAIGVVEAVGEAVTGFAIGDAGGTGRLNGGYCQANTGPASGFGPAPPGARGDPAPGATGRARPRGAGG
ncbi:MAG: alcohol dehydrogenase catalytic domain-containing protein, partial [Blastomonas sp.]|nr:alcohol dehydrogenase catalytic domain-containing protein [Blastomonas sp.]